MLEALEYAKTNGNKITRHAGGFWAKAEGWDRNQSYFGTTTIMALVQRELATYTQWKERGKDMGSFPIEITVKGEWKRVIEIIKLKVAPGDWRAIGAVEWDTHIPFKRPLDKRSYRRERISVTRVAAGYWGGWYDSQSKK